MTGFTDDQLSTGGQQVQAPPVGTGPDPADLAAKVASASATEVDVASLLAQLQAQQDALTAEVARMRAGRAPEGEHPLIATAAAARGLIAEHLDRGYKGDKAMMLRLADDLIDAAGNAVTSGDTAAVRQVAKRLETELNRINPGPGDHHYFRNALALTGYHLPLAADTVTGPQPGRAPAVTGGAPVKVVAGSVTG